MAAIGDGVPIYPSAKHCARVGEPLRPCTSICCCAGPAVRNRDGRRLAQQKLITRQSPKVTTWPPPVGWDEPDKVHSGAASPVGAPGTYNHLTDALLDVAATRQMYLRRLRSLADLFFSQGRLKEIVAQVYDSIKDVAVKVRAQAVPCCARLRPPGRACCPVPKLGPAAPPTDLPFSGCTALGGQEHRVGAQAGGLRVHPHPG